MIVKIASIMFATAVICSAEISDIGKRLGADVDVAVR
jgi:hypothetical protein